MKRTLVLLVLAAALLGFCDPYGRPTAQAATRPELGYHANRPASIGGPTCDADHLRSCSASVLVDLIGGVPCGPGSYIDGSLFSLTVAPVRTALTAKAACGVRGRITTWQPKDDDGDEIEQWTQIDLLLPVLRRAGWQVTVCRGSCLRSGKAGAHHEAVWAFSSTGGVPNVLYVPSGNPTYRMDVGLNDAQTFSDRACYRGVIAWRDLQAKDRTPKHSPGRIRCTDPRRSLWISPGTTDPVAKLLHQAKPAPGCRVYEAMSRVTYSSRRAAVYTDMVRLRKAGCRVTVVVNRTGTWSEKIIARLLAGGVEVRNASVGILYNHQKTDAVASVKVDGKLVSVAWSGKTNRTAESWSTNDNVLAETRLPGDVAGVFAYADNIAPKLPKLTR